MIDPATVPTSRRLVQCVTSVFFCLLSAGVIFGFTALKPVLLAKGVYSEVCDHHTPKCAKQDAKLNLMFTLATVCTNVASLPIGAILDRLGPQKTACVGAIIFALGNFLFGLQSEHFDTYLAGFLLISIGGPMIFLSSFHLSNAFTQHSGLILSAITGAFDASSLPYLGYNQVYKYYGISIRHYFWTYTIVAGAIILQQLLIGCKEPYGVVASGPDSTPIAETESSPLLQSTDSSRPLPPKRQRSRRHSRVHYSDVHDTDDHSLFKESLAKRDGLTGQLFGKSAKEQILTSWFVAITAYACVQMCRLNFYMETAEAQLLFYTGDPRLSETLTTAFTVLLPLGGILSIPIIGAILDKRTSKDAFAILLVSGILCGVFGLSSRPSLQIAGITIFAVLRPMMYTSISDYCAKCFSFASFGRVYGLLNTLAGLFGLSQWALDLAVKFPLGGNPTVVNVGLLLVGSLTNILLLVRMSRISTQTGAQ